MNKTRMMIFVVHCPHLSPEGSLTPCSPPTFPFISKLRSKHRRLVLLFLSFFFFSIMMNGFRYT